MSHYTFRWLLFCKAVAKCIKLGLIQCHKPQLWIWHLLKRIGLNTFWFFLENVTHFRSLFGWEIPIHLWHTVSHWNIVEVALLTMAIRWLGFLWHQKTTYFMFLILLRGVFGNLCSFALAFLQRLAILLKNSKHNWRCVEAFCKD